MPVEIAATPASALRNVTPYSASGRRAWGFGLPEHDHQRVAGVAVDEVQRPGVSGLGLQRGEHFP